MSVSIKNFRFNVTVAYFYEIYKLFKEYLELDINKDVLKKNINTGSIKIYDVKINNFDSPIKNKEQLKNYFKKTH